MAQDLVLNPTKYKFYDDTLAVILLLSQRFKLGIISDAWPSLIAVYDKAQLTSYFSSIIISSFYGITKPHPKMYQLALDELNLVPEQTLFIDDNLKNCLGAKHSMLLCRNWHHYQLEKIKCLGQGYDVIYSLEQLLN